MMTKELMHDPIFLTGKSEVATKKDFRFEMAAEENLHLLGRTNDFLFVGELI